MSRYDRLRRRLAPVALLVAIALIGYDAWEAHDRTHATVVIDFGDAAREVRAVEAEIWMNGEQVTRFRKVASEGALIGPIRFAASLPDTRGELRVDVELPAGVRRQVVRRLTAREGATTTFRIDRELAGRDVPVPVAP